MRLCTICKIQGGGGRLQLPMITMQVGIGLLLLSIPPKAVEACRNEATPQSLTRSRSALHGQSVLHGLTVLLLVQDAVMILRKLYDVGHRTRGHKVTLPAFRCPSVRSGAPWALKRHQPLRWESCQPCGGRMYFPFFFPLLGIISLRDMPRRQLRMESLILSRKSVARNVSSDVTRREREARLPL